MEQILENTYYENEVRWDKIARDLGGIEICDDITGDPIYTVGSDLLAGGLKMDEDNEMNEKQYGLLLAIKEALEAQPDQPSYDDYEEGTISRKQFYDRRAQYQLVEDIKMLLWN